MSKMRSFELKIPVEVVATADLDPQRRALVEKARAAVERAYAPYSNFHVGAAIELDNGTIVEGSNQENAAYPSGTCAERTAAFYAHSTYPDAKFVRIAIAARNSVGEVSEEPISPCGGCRQALLQYELLAGRNVEVILAGKESVHILPSVGSLLPFGFNSLI